ncbi:hypothetical protein GA0074695_6302 [Micromonospora viridifaciens]|uniref:Uncharacterized protein n=1 Tax=Micromonospora viridifaciens TaxID=1881 RepID=A0A1C4ZYB5_MICVI|nr:hypothetical protein [Micromonospora viridifaciens]SCF37744.1 hypothetical protein GA0074695_6302 [Micromonospora viridifaciens]
MLAGALLDEPLLDPDEPLLDPDEPLVEADEPLLDPFDELDDDSDLAGLLVELVALSDPEERESVR